MKRRITPNHMSTINGLNIPIIKFDWKAEVAKRELVRVERTKIIIKNSKTVKNYRPNDRVILQDMDKKGRWSKRGKIIKETKGKEFIYHTIR